MEPGDPRKDLMNAVLDLVKASFDVIDAFNAAKVLNYSPVLEPLSGPITALHKALIPLDGARVRIIPATTCPSCGRLPGYHAEGCGASDEMGG